MADEATVAADVAAIEAAAEHIASASIAPAAPAAAKVLHSVVIEPGSVTQSLTYIAPGGAVGSLVLDVGNPVLAGFHHALAEWWSVLEGAAFDYQQRLKLVGGE